MIDEAQRIPELFDEVQVSLDRDPSLRVLLTGSSARKLRRNGVNLLPGRIWQERLFPLVFPELGSARIEDRLVRGSLPGIIDNEEFRAELKNYVGLYLDEEFRAEGLVEQRRTGFRSKDGAAQSLLRFAVPVRFDSGALPNGRDDLHFADCSASTKLGHRIRW